MGGGVGGAEEILEVQDGTVVAVEGRQTARGGAGRRTEIKSNKEGCERARGSEGWKSRSNSAMGKAGAFHFKQCALIVQENPIMGTRAKHT